MASSSPIFADLLVATLEPIQQRYNELITSPELDVILDEGAAKAHAKASHNVS